MRRPVRPLVAALEQQPTAAAALEDGGDDNLDGTPTEVTGEDPPKAEQTEEEVEKVDTPLEVKEPPAAQAKKDEPPAPPSEAEAATKDADESLNAGLELDDDDGPAQKAPTPIEADGQTPAPELPDPVELSHPESDLIALEAALQDLIYLSDDLAKAGGMSRAIAVEAQKIIPEFGGVPLGYYTELPSATRYQTSLESVQSAVKETASKIWEAIKKICATIREHLKKFVAWLKSHLKADPATVMKDHEEISHKLHAVYGSLERVQSALALDQGVGSLDEFAKEHLPHVTFFSHPRGLPCAFLQASNWSVQVKALCNKLPYVPSVLIDKAHSLHSALDHGQSSGEHIEELNKKVREGELDRPVGLEGYRNLKDAAEKMREARRQAEKLQLQARPVTVGLALMGTTATNTGTKEAYHIIAEADEQVGKIDDALKQLEDALGKSETGEFNVEMKEVAAVVRRSLHALTADLSGYLSAVAEIRMWVVSFEMCVHSALRAAQEVVASIHSKLYKGGEMPEPLKKAIEEFQEAAQADAPFLFFKKAA